MESKNRHIVGALGYGIYINSSVDVTQCWLEVLRENKFQGSWWRGCILMCHPEKLVQANQNLD